MDPIDPNAEPDLSDYVPADSPAATPEPDPAVLEALHAADDPVDAAQDDGTAPSEEGAGD